MNIEFMNPENVKNMIKYGENGGRSDLKTLKLTPDVGNEILD